MNNLLDDLNNLIQLKLVPVAKSVLFPIGKAVFCQFTDVNKKKAMIIDHIMKMSEPEIDNIIIDNKGLVGRIFIRFASFDTKRKKVIDSINNMDEKSINKIIIKS